jgi:hypothetical protein
MYIQLDRNNGALVGYLKEDPDERFDNKGDRMVVLDVYFDAAREIKDGHRRNEYYRMPVVVFGEYTSYARTLCKGDCIIAIGRRKLEKPRGFTTNPLMVSKRNFGFIGGTGITRAWLSELDAYQKNEAARRLEQIKPKRGKKKAQEDNDKFTDIKGDWY